MILATARTIVGRKGTFFSTVGLALLGVIAVAVIRVIVNARNPDIHPSIGGAIFADEAGGIIFFVGVLGGVLMGALAGSYDVAQGTMRYLVMTGVSRLRIYAARGIALVASVFVALVPGCRRSRDRASTATTCWWPCGRSRSSPGSTRW